MDDFKGVKGMKLFEIKSYIFFSFDRTTGSKFPPNSIFGSEIVFFR